MSQFFSPREVAAALGVSESSLKRWVDKGLIPAQKTGGGHRRLPLDSVLRYVRRERMVLANPEAIGLPPGTGDDTAIEHASGIEFLTALREGNEPEARRIILDAFLSGESIAEICDRMLAPAFHRLGELWRCNQIEVYQERRACEVCLRVIHELRRAVGSGQANAPLALGATLDGDPYTLAVSMGEVVLRDLGWRSVSLGNMLPFETLHRAIETDRPRLMWLSVTSIRDADRFIASFNTLFDTASAWGCALVVGGQAFGSDIRQRLRYTTYCDTFGHMAAFARTLYTESGQ